jgi:cell division protein FtsW
VLLVIGMVMVYSASMATAEAAARPAISQAISWITTWRFSDRRAGRSRNRFSGPADRPGSAGRRGSSLPVSRLLALVLIPGIGRDVNGARRWLRSGVVNLQPSELMKLFAVLYAADYTARKMPHMHDLKESLSASGERHGRGRHAAAQGAGLRRLSSSSSRSPWRSSSSAACGRVCSSS